jgi:hypothetical protein
MRRSQILCWHAKVQVCSYSFLIIYYHSNLAMVLASWWRYDISGLAAPPLHNTDALYILGGLYPLELRAVLTLILLSSLTNFHSGDKYQGPMIHSSLTAKLDIFLGERSFSTTLF